MEATVIVAKVLEDFHLFRYSEFFNKITLEHITEIDIRSILLYGIVLE